MHLMELGDYADSLCNDNTNKYSANRRRTLREVRMLVDGFRT